MEAFNLTDNKLTATSSDADISFYTVDSTTKPIPYGLSMVEFVSNTDKTVKSASIMYDPYDILPNSIQMLVWVRPVPYSTPLYIYTGTNNLTLTFKKDDTLTPYVLPVIFVLTDPKDGLPSVYRKNDFKSDRFTFSRDMGRCIPDINSKMGLNACLRDFPVDNHDINLLGYIAKHKGSNIMFYVLITIVIGTNLYLYRVLR